MMNTKYRYIHFLPASLPQVAPPPPPYLQGSLGKDVFERRSSTEVYFFAFFGSGFARIFEQIVSKE